MAPLRFPLSLVAALGLTMGMFWGLQSMIRVTGAFEAFQPAAKIEFVRLRRDSVVEEKKRVKPVFEKPAEPPPSAPEIATAEKTSVIAGTDIASLAPSVDFSAVGSGGIGRSGNLAAELSSGGGVDRDAVPQVRIQPDYPIGARQKGIEGWVDVQFSVGMDGGVRNAVVVGAEPKSIFDSAALQAVRGWKYSPRIKDGKPVERSGMRVRIRFNLET